MHIGPDKKQPPSTHGSGLGELSETGSMRLVGVCPLPPRHFSPSPRIFSFGRFAMRFNGHLVFGL